MSNAFLRLFTLAALVAGGAQAACSYDYYPVKEGLSRTYQTVAGGQTATYTETISQVTGSSFKLTNSRMPGASSTSRCGPNGITSVSQTAAPGMKITQMRGVTYPPVLKVGTAWTSGVTMKGEAQGQTMESSFDVKSRVVGSEKVTVKAGTFDALKVQTTTTMTMVMNGKKVNQPPLEATTWLVKGLGMVKTVTANASLELVNYTK